MAETTSTEIVKTETEPSTSGTILARIKPHNPRAGLTVKSYTYKGHRFREESGWYKIPADLGEDLRTLVADESDPYSPFLFDVLSEAEAQKVEELEHKRRERATASRPNANPDLRRTDTRRLAAAANAQKTQAATGVVTTSSLRAPNDEVIPNGYPPPRTYPMPQAGVATQTTSSVASVAIESGHEDQDDDLIDEAKKVGVDDKTLGTNAANLTRDMNGGPPLIDGQGFDEDEPNVEGTIDFGADPADPSAPATPPSARRRKRGG